MTEAGSIATLMQDAVRDWSACLEWDVLPEKLAIHLPRLLGEHGWGLWVRSDADTDYRLHLGNLPRCGIVDSVWQQSQAQDNCYPLVLADHRYGVIRLTGDSPAWASGIGEQNWFPFMLSMLSRSIHNALFVENIRNLTVTDDVTGLYNSRFLHKTLEKEYQRSLRYGSHFSVIFLDLDYFKHVNDNHGHLVGTDVLRETGQVIVQTLRESDLATRYGGDEFVVILPETEKGEAIIVARRILDSIRTYTYGRDHGLQVSLTASLGIATYPTDTKDQLDLIKLSDEAMYRVKEASRNDIATVEGLLAHQ